MIVLEPKNLTWITERKDDSEDLCAHGKVRFEIDGVKIVSVDDGEWTVSAAALYLLRTLDSEYAKKTPSFEQIFPCCGFSMYDTEDKDVVIIGCPSGIDLQIMRHGNNVEIQAKGKNAITVSYSAWRDAVVSFSKTVRAFYASSSPKKPFDVEAQKGFNKFWKISRCF